MKQYDVIVVGVGSMGSATLCDLAKNGLKVMGLEQFELANDLSSHTGQSRLIRLAYFENPNYVPLLKMPTVVGEKLRKMRVIYFTRQELRIMGNLKAL